MPATTDNSLLWDEKRLADPHAQQDKAARVREMFDRIAPTYERVNHVLSAGRDAYWRRRAVELANVRQNDTVLDVACGTGDFSRAFAAARPARVVGTDFAIGMLSLAPARTTAPVQWCRADALSLPFASATFSVAGCAFGVRNFQDLSAGLREFHRILCPGGRAVILEFGMPRSRLFGGLYRLYFRSVLPAAAARISGDRSGAYDYLPQSVSTFIDARGMAVALRSAGFTQIRQTPLTWGIVMVHVATKD